MVMQEWPAERRNACISFNQLVYAWRFLCWNEKAIRTLEDCEPYTNHLCYWRFGECFMVAVKINTGLGVCLQKSTTIISGGVVSDKGPTLHCQRIWRTGPSFQLLCCNGKLNVWDRTWRGMNSRSDSLVKVNCSKWPIAVINVFLKKKPKQQQQQRRTLLRLGFTVLQGIKSEVVRLLLGGKGSRSKKRST